MKSYMLQDSRRQRQPASSGGEDQMVRAGGGEGTTSHSLQHDGIVAIVGEGEESDRAAEGMAKEATAACGYGVKVIPKRAPITVDYGTRSSSEAATGTLLP